jgi:CO dehydrogenase nickel-insertion accessory protein CooC1
MTIFLLAQEIEDAKFNITLNVVAEVKYSQQMQANNIEAEFIAQIPLNRSVESMEFERQPASSFYPILIRFTSSQQNLYVYLKP